MMNKLALYIHIPFCERKCRYCDFLSFADRHMLIGRYIDQLGREIGDSSEEHGGREVSSIYIGGGTPSVLRAGMISDIMHIMRETYDLDADAEISIEVNPGSADRDKLSEYRECGINRLSIGLQSAHDHELNVLGRIHTLADFEDTYRTAREAGFDNINIDLISAIPGQDIESWRSTLDHVAGLKPEHISAYSLQLEEGTYFFDHQDEYAWVDEDTDREMYHMTSRILGAAGYDRYEISNYARPGYECRHNIVYWRGGDYLGFGIGAASYMDGARFKNTDSIEEYLRGIRCVESTPLSVPDMMAEYMFLGMRMSAGISKRGFEERFGRAVTDVYEHQIAECVRDGLIADAGDTYRLTERGSDISNYVFAKFL